jgi:glycine hydroxymethyltransferase
VAVAADQLERLRTLGLSEIDPDVAALIGREADRQRHQIELIASENFTWPSVLEAVGSVLTNKYAEGYPGRRYYGGCEFVDEVEQLAIDRAKELFGAEHANVQPHAGAQANMAVYTALIQPGDTVLALRLDHGGHLTHGLKVNFSGRLYSVVHYGVSRETALVEEEEVLALAREHRPKLIICGGSAYPRTVDTAMFRRVADEVGALLWCDMAHFAGLVAAGLHPNPVEHCDVVSSTTHKTLAGPRSGLVLSREEHAQAIDRAVFPGLQGGPLEHVIAAKATCFKIAASDEFRAYQGQIRTNADALADSLLAGGLELLTGGTDTHLLQIDLRSTEWTGKDAEERLHAVGLTTNRNTVPFDERPPTVASGVRVGTQAATIRGFDDDDFREVGRIIVEALGPDADRSALRARAEALCERRPRYPGFRGYPTYHGDGCTTWRSRAHLARPGPKASRRCSIRSSSTSSGSCATSPRRRRCSDSS